MRLSGLILLLILIPSLTGCGDSGSKDKKKAPAKVEKHPTESDVYQITLTDKARERLGITDKTTARIEKKTIPRHRVLGGEVMIPPGRTIIVTAPLPGTLQPVKDKDLPPPGSRVEAGDALFTFVPLLSPERDVPTPAERIQMANARASLATAQTLAAGDVKQAKAEVKAAHIALDLARQLLMDRTGSQRAVNDAEAALSIAEKKLEAADDRKKVLDGLTLEEEKGKLKTFDITVPERGILRNLTAAKGQTVTAGTPLFEVVNPDVVWVRVPVYVGQMDEIDTKGKVTIGNLRGEPDPSKTEEPKEATFVAAPPSADPLAATADVYFKVSNVDGGLRPGERVGVTLPLKGNAEHHVVPWGAILRDVNGTTWVYERVKPNVFRRRRVLVDYVIGETAVLARSPEAGTEVVVDGAPELFGTEFGAGK